MISAEEMREMIQNEIHSISNLDERVAFKELMEGVFLSLFEMNEQMYEALERRVMDDLAYDRNHYLIRTGIVEKQYVDRSHHMMFPMKEEDFAQRNYRLSDMISALKSDGNYQLMSVLIQCDYANLQKLWSLKPKFRGMMEMEDHENYDFTVELLPDDSYLDSISHLYRLFSRNGIPWQTINAPYLYKMGKVILTDLPDGIDANRSIKRFQIDFGQHSQLIRYDMIPVWNIEKIKLETIGFPVPCEDKVNYEHALSIRDYGEEHAYLIDEEIGIQSISQRNKKLYVTTGIKDARKWNIYMIRNMKDKKIDRYTYPIMKNLRTETFTEKYQRKWNEPIKTKAELARFIRGFELNKYLEYQGCVIADQFAAPPETYGMNVFIEDEIRDRKNAKKLILKFKAREYESWLSRDIASFIVSEVQRLYPEYECGGEFL